MRQCDHINFATQWRNIHASNKKKLYKLTFQKTLNILLATVAIPSLNQKTWKKEITKRITCAYLESLFITCKSGGTRTARELSNVCMYGKKEMSGSWHILCMIPVDVIFGEYY